MLEVEVLGERPAAGAPAPERIGELCELAAAARGVSHGHVAVEFVGAGRIAELNARHRGKDAPTDVLSFPIDGAGPGGSGPEASGPLELGDIVICAAHTSDIEEAVVHGMLHLLGMDHETDDGEMLTLQDQLMRRSRA
jgi:probable rRNA maturation factor